MFPARRFSLSSCTLPPANFFKDTVIVSFFKDTILHSRRDHLQVEEATKNVALNSCFFSLFFFFAFSAFFFFFAWA